MIKFVPKTAAQAGLNSDDNIFIYTGYDLTSDEECGKCIFKLNGYDMSILKIDSESDDETIEGLIRSALNYGANRGAYIASFDADKGINVALLLGFKEKDGSLTGEIPELLAGSCCKKSN